MTNDYDVVLSFAGEDRPVVERTRAVLLTAGVRVFYDLDFQHDLLGKDLAEFFSDLYQNRARYCVLFISKNYIDKAWCRWERRAALARALKTRHEYVIPYFLEQVDLPSVPTTIGAAQVWNTSPEQFAHLLLRKLHSAEAVLQISQSVALSSLQRDDCLFMHIRDWFRECVDWDEVGLAYEVYGMCKITNFTDTSIDIGGELKSEDGWRSVIRGVDIRDGTTAPGGTGTVVPAHKTLPICFMLGSLAWWRVVDEDKVTRSHAGPADFLKRVPVSLVPSSSDPAKTFLSENEWKFIDGLKYQLRIESADSAIGICVIGGKLQFHILSNL